nr:ribbon-helix-helix protein, CopG family [Candidatus Freyarchaeota archaeon]
MVSRKVSVSLPEKLLKRVDEAANRSGMSRSEFITRVLERVVQPEEEPHRYPTVLWKLQKSGYIKLRSPRFPTRIVGEWVVEEVEE